MVTEVGAGAFAEEETVAHEVKLVRSAPRVLVRAVRQHGVPGHQHHRAGGRVLLRGQEREVCLWVSCYQ